MNDNKALVSTNEEENPMTSETFIDIESRTFKSPLPTRYSLISSPQLTRRKSCLNEKKRKRNIEDDDEEEKCGDDFICPDFLILKLDQHKDNNNHKSRTLSVLKLDPEDLPETQFTLIPPFRTISSPSECHLPRLQLRRRYKFPRQFPQPYKNKSHKVDILEREFQGWTLDQNNLSF
mmetsp:Transcript_15705/g.19148  ORF Transcript_15705/g.19148 Transcript_15705/m.19148 type:complete len:177 (-) Transcript_15705:261-791(-)